MRRLRGKLKRLPEIGEELLIKTDKATTMDALQIIERVAALSALEPEVIHIADCLKDYQTIDELANNLATFAYRSAYFEPDSNDHQRVKTVSRILRDGKTNCVGYSTLISSILTVLGLPHTLRLVATGDKGFSHIYPILQGIAIDVVPIQDQFGFEHLTRINGTVPQIGVEIPYKRKFDLLITPKNEINRTKRM